MILRNTLFILRTRGDGDCEGAIAPLAIFSVVTILKKNPTIWSSRVFSGTFMIFNISYIYMRVCACACMDDDLNDENNIIHMYHIHGGSIWKFNSVGLLILEMPLFRPRYTHTHISCFVHII